MKKLVLFAAVALLAAACGSSEDTTTTTAAAATTTTAAPETTTTTAAPETTTTSAAPETTTTEASADGAVFALGEVVFGPEGYVAITNLGTEAGDIGGFQICQFPTYFGIPSHELAPGDTLYVAVGSAADLDVDGEVIEAGAAFGGLSAVSGEIGLYRSSSFGSTSAIVSYVEWGSSGHERSGVAVGAGIWGEGDRVDVDGAALIRAVEAPPLGAADWETG